MSSITHQPLRTCVGCGAKKSQRELLRVATNEAGEPVVDVKYSAPGRGAYLCRMKSCVERALARRAVERSLKLKTSLGAGLKAELEKQLIDREPRGV